MKSKISGFAHAVSPGKPGEIVESADIYQSSCWHCHAMWFKPAVEEIAGLRCQYCGQLNDYTGLDRIFPPAE